MIGALSCELTQPQRYNRISRNEEDMCGAVLFSDSHEVLEHELDDVFFVFVPLIEEIALIERNDGVVVIGRHIGLI